MLTKLLVQRIKTLFISRKSANMKHFYNWSTKNILIVEDSHVNRLLFKVMLENTKVSIKFACNSKEFFEVIKDKAFDLILMDISLGEKYTGIDLIEYMQDNSINIPVIIQTAYIDEYYIHPRIKYHSIVKKPIDFNLLFKNMSNILN